MQDFLERHFVECECRDPDHIFVVDIYKWDAETEDYEFQIHHQLVSHYSILSRIRSAIRFIFKRPEKDYMFADSMLNLEQVKKLRDVCNKFIKLYEK